MGEPPQSIDRRGAGRARSDRVERQIVPLLFAVEEHVFLAREMVEHRHTPDVGRVGDLVDRHMVEAARHEQSRGDVGDRLTRRQAFARPPIRVAIL